MESDRDGLRLIRRGIEDVQLGSGMVDDALAVGCRVAHVEIAVMRMPAHVCAVRQAGVEIADALVVGHEVDTLTHPERRGDIALQLQQTPPVTLTGGVNPQIAHLPAAVAFPARQVGGMAADDHAAGWAKGDADRRAGGQALRFPALARHGVKK